MDITKPFLKSEHDRSPSFLLFFLELESGLIDGDWESLRIVRLVPFVKSEYDPLLFPLIFFSELKSGLTDGDQGHGLLLQRQGLNRVHPAPSDKFPKAQIRPH